MIHIPFKWNSTAIDDDDLRAIAPVVKTHMTGGTPKQKTYALLLAKMMFRISELKAAAQPTAQTAEPVGYTWMNLPKGWGKPVKEIGFTAPTYIPTDKLTPLYTHPAKTGAVPGTPPTDERIKEIWESLGYRTRFAPYLLRLVRAVLSDVAPQPAPEQKDAVQ